jgi:hypothetical protein
MFWLRDLDGCCSYVAVLVVAVLFRKKADGNGDSILE